MPEKSKQKRRGALKSKHLELRLRKWTAYNVVSVWLVHRNGAVGQGLLHGTVAPDMADDVAEWFKSRGVKLFLEDCDLECADDAPLRDAADTKSQKSLLWNEESNE